MDRQAILKQLDDNGYCVIPNVLSTENCDESLGELQKWYTGFKETGTRLNARRTVIQSYRVGHFETVWKCRLQCKPVFELLWGTKKLLTSVDGIALQNPLEEGDNEFRQPDHYWSHLDQNVKRQGLHGYQGALYLEETTEQDYCFRVIKRSHKYHSGFFEKFPRAADKSRKMEFYKLNKSQRTWYADHGCQQVYVPVPKGGMVIWDSRTVHDTSPPVMTRPNKEKWRCVIFVCMTPAFWAGKADILFKQEAYNNLQLTTHWPSQGQKTFKNYTTTKRKSDGNVIDTLSITELPSIAKTSTAKLLIGVEQYDFEDGTPNGPPPPVWIK